MYYLHEYQALSQLHGAYDTINSKEKIKMSYKIDYFYQKQVYAHIVQMGIFGFTQS